METTEEEERAETKTTNAPIVLALGQTKTARRSPEGQGRARGRSQGAREKPRQSPTPTSPRENFDFQAGIAPGAERLHSCFNGIETVR